MALKLPPEAHNQSPLFGALWAIFMIRGPSKFILQKDATQKSATVNKNSWSCQKSNKLPCHGTIDNVSDLYLNKCSTIMICKS